MERKKKMSEMITLPYGQIYTLSFYELQSSSDKTGALEPILKDNKIILTSPEQQWFWTEEWQAGEVKVDEYILKGEIEEFGNMEEFLNTLKN